MKIIIHFLTFFLFLFIFFGCGGDDSKEKEKQPSKRPALRMGATEVSPNAAESAPVGAFYDDLAEMERSGSWITGMGLTESSVRENDGDFTGAVTAAYKEMSWAYGRGLIQKDDVEKGILNVISAGGDEAVKVAANVLLAFFKENWSEAGAGLEILFSDSALEEPDSFGRWMILVCILEKESEVSSGEFKRACAAYKSIRARYAQFPEYWYRGARAFSGAVAAAYAENCINSSVNGPFAKECRSILASYSGLKIEDGISIKTKIEIESIIANSVNSGNPVFLDPLLPLIELPDNPYTIYAVGVLRALNNVPVFRDYFSAHASSADGRLAERLSYISRS